MTYLQYNEISLGEGGSVDLEQDVMRASEERSIAIRAIARAFTCRWQGFLLHARQDAAAPDADRG